MLGSLIASQQALFVSQSLSYLLEIIPQPQLFEPGKLRPWPQLCSTAIPLLRLALSLLLLLNQNPVFSQAYSQDNDSYFQEGSDNETNQGTILPAAAPPLSISPFPAAKQQQIIEALDYNPKPERERKERERKQKEKQAAEKQAEKGESWWDRWNTPRDIGPLDIPGWLFYLLLALLLGICAYVIYQLLDGKFTPRPKEENNQDRRVELEEIQEDQISFRETESLLERAVRNEQYELAVRLQYLSLLKRLHEIRLIVFKKEKVNRAYLFEMDKQPLGKDFRKITLDYERNWYGNYPTDRLSYRLVAKRFELMQEQLDKIEQPAHE